MNISPKTLRTVRDVTFAVIRIAGPIATAALGIKAGVDINDAIKEGRYDMKVISEDGKEEITTLTWEDLTTKEKIRIAIPIFLPVGILTATTITSACLDKHIDTKHIKELNGLYSVAAASAVTYRQKLEEKDPEAAKKADVEVAERTKEEIPFKDDKVVGRVEIADGGGETLFVDSLTGRQFLSTVENVQAAIDKTEKEYDYDVNNENYLQLNETPLEFYERCGWWPSKYLALNQFYLNLGIEMTSFGSMFGYAASFDKDTNQWDYTGDQIGFHLEEGHDGTYYIMYDVYPWDGYWEV